MTTQTIINFEREGYKALCDELKEVMQLRKEAEVREKELKSLVIEQSGGDRMEFGIKVSTRVRAGSYDMDKIFTDLKITKDQAEKYRKEASMYVDVRGY